MARTNVRWRIEEEIIAPEPDKPLPQNLEAEQALLGSVAVSKQALPEVVGIITPEHFTRDIHAKLYQLIVWAYEDGAESIHPDMMQDQLTKHGQAVHVEELSYFDAVLNSEPTWRNAGYWAMQVHEVYLRRRVVLASLLFTRQAQDDSAHPGDVLMHALELVSLAGEYVSPSGGSVSIPYEKLLKDDVPPLRWVVDRLLPAQGMTMIAGDPGVGKSWVCYHLAQCVASGKPFLGHFDVSKTGVLVVDAEGSENLVQRRLRKLHNGLFGADTGDEAMDVPLLLLPHGIRLDEPKSEELMVAEISRGGVGLVIIDPLVMTHSLDENSSTEMAKVFQALRRIGERTACTFLLVHHVRKQSMGSNQAAQRLRGSTAILGFLDSYLFLRQIRTGCMSVEHAKSRHAEPVEDFLIEMKDPDDSTTVLAYEGESKDSPDKTQSALDFILRTLADNSGSLRRKEIEAVAQYEEVSLASIDRALKEGYASGRLVKPQHGVYSLPEKQLDLQPD